MDKMRKMVEDRAKLIHEIVELNSRKHHMEHDITKAIIEEGMIDVLSVNWNRLHRTIGLPLAKHMF